MQTYHAVCFQQLENGCVDWGDDAKKLEFRHAEVWNPMHRYRSPPYKIQPSAQPRQRVGKDVTSKPAMAKSGTKTSTDKCMTQTEHPKQLHICTYCMAVACKQCANQEHFCHGKTYDEATKN